MGLSNTIQGATEKAFDALGDIAKAITVTTKTQIYVPSTGVSSDSSTITVVPKSIKAKYKHYEIDGATVRPQDQKFLFPVASLSTEPRPKLDTITDDQSVVWQIIQVAVDPSNSLYTVQVRKS